MRYPELRDTLVKLRSRDEAVRTRLAAEGSLFDGYHPEMEAVHRANAEQLRTIIQEVGWPGRKHVGDEGAEAAWIIVQHSIGEPEFMRRAFRLLTAAVERGDVPAWQVAHLEDRICALEGRRQRFGTQFDWNEESQLVPWPPVEDPETVDDRRAAVSLPPLAEAAARHKAATPEESRPTDPMTRRRKAETWARQRGWRD